MDCAKRSYPGSIFRNSIALFRAVALLITSSLLFIPVPALAAVDTSYTISGNAGVAGATLSYTDGVPLTATSDETGAYSLAVSAGWSGTVTPSKTGYTFSPPYIDYPPVNADQTGQDYTATAIEYTLTIVSDHGTVNRDKVPPYHYGDVVILTANPDLGWTFSDWSGDVVSSTNPVGVTMDGNKTVTANYVENTFSLTVISDHGTVAKSPDKPAYAYGDLVQLTATPDPGWALASWSGGATSTANPVLLTILGDTTVTANYAALTTLTLQSTGAYDGWVLEKGEFAGAGGTLDSASPTFNVGDDAANKQYRSIVSFNTGALPDTAGITSVTLKVKQAGEVGASPFASLGNIAVDVRTGPFSSNRLLELTDFKAASSKDRLLVFTNSAVGGWFTKALGAGDLGYVNKAGVTQFRLRFAKDDNNNLAADYIKFYSGNYVLDPSSRPTLIITYFIP